MAALVRPAQRVLRTWHMDSRRWDGFRVRDGDIVVATYPKCGTTWTQRIVSLLVFRSAEPRPLTISPWIDERFLGSLEAINAVVEPQQHRRFLKSHLPFDAMPIYRGVSYIHVARDGLDAMMSWHNHQVRYKRMDLLDKAGMRDETIAKPYPRPAEHPRDFFRDWMGLAGAERMSDVSAGSFFDTERSYWTARTESNLLLVHFNDLLADLDAEMLRIAEFLKIEIPTSLWPELVRAATFDEMRRDGASLMPFAKAAWTGGHEDFIYAGKNERWRGVLTEADVALYRTRAAQELDPALNRWLAHGREGGNSALSR